MHLPEQKISSLPYIPARLTEGKEWYISYWAFNPAKEKLDRKKVKLNRIQSVAQRRTIARKMMIDINNQLQTGWSPFVEQEAPKAFHKLSEALNTWITQALKDCKKENTRRSYNSQLKKLTDYLKKQGKNDIYAYQFSPALAGDLMLEIGKNVGKVTFNNNLAFFNIIFDWLKEYSYIKNNPFANIHPKSLRGHIVEKEPISPETRKAIAKYLLTNNFNYLTMMMIEYYCLVRPGDLVALRKKNFDCSKWLIEVKDETTKNGKTSYRTIPLDLIPYIRKLNLSGNQDDFVFSDDGKYGFTPGPIKCCPRKISRYWDSLRPKFNLTLKHKFYCLKNSGIIEMLENNISPEDTRQQADHGDLTMTTKYSRHIKPNGSVQIRKFKGF